MVIAGEWRIDEDGISRPYLALEVGGKDGAIAEEAFLVDTGADCTVFTARLLSKLSGSLDAESDQSVLLGIGGQSEAVTVRAELRFRTMQGTQVTVHGEFAAAIGSTSLDVSLLGRGVLANFDVIVSRRRNDVLLIAGNHFYSVTG